jgi:hypothetical protein
MNLRLRQRLVTLEFIGMGNHRGKAKHIQYTVEFIGMGNHPGKAKHIQYTEPFDVLRKVALLVDHLVSTRLVACSFVQVN